MTPIPELVKGIWAKRYIGLDREPEENLQLMAGLCEAFRTEEKCVAAGKPAEAALIYWAHILDDPHQVAWTVHVDGRLAGFIRLYRISLQHDAQLEFAFFDHNLAGKRKLLNNVIDQCLSEPIGFVGGEVVGPFMRLSMEVPDTGKSKNKLERFLRNSLGFRYEGENRPRNPELPTSLNESWVAREGSRLELGHLEGTERCDLIRLRVLATERVGTGEGEVGS